MKFLLLLAFAVLVRTDEIKKDNGVLVLEKDTFQTAVTDNKYILVEFCKSNFFTTTIANNWNCQWEIFKSFGPEKLFRLKCLLRVLGQYIFLHIC